MTQSKFLTYDEATKTLLCSHHWTLLNIPALKRSLKKLNLSEEKTLTVDGSHIKKLDSAGAWVFLQFFSKKNINIDSQNFSEPHQKLINLIQKQTEGAEENSEPASLNFLQNIGKNSVEALQEFYKYLTFVGKLTFEALAILKNPSKFRMKACINAIHTTGVNALMIIALLSFMIGIVITYQMGFQLKTYGANIFIVDLLGLAVLREFAPLLTAIMVAGRTGSAFTAQLGTMKINQEIDALDTMGVSAYGILILPRIFGLFIALPLLTIWSDIFGILGGMLMSKSMLDISWFDFLNRFHHVVSLKSLLLGLSKAPVFALIISSVGCFEGTQVGGSADSVGLQTTKSVVLAIFFIIIADAFFSILFSKFGL